MSTKTAFMRIERMLLWTKPKYEFKVLQDIPLLFSKHRQLSKLIKHCKVQRSEFCRLLSLFIDLELRNLAFIVTLNDQFNAIKLVIQSILFCEKDDLKLQIDLSSLGLFLDHVFFILINDCLIHFFLLPSTFLLFSYTPSFIYLFSCQTLKFNLMFYFIFSESNKVLD